MLGITCFLTTDVRNQYFEALTYLVSSTLFLL